MSLRLLGWVRDFNAWQVRRAARRLSICEDRARWLQERLT